MKMPRHRHVYCYILVRNVVGPNSVHFIWSDFDT